MQKKVQSYRNEDKYVKYECEACKRAFIVGEELSRGMSMACPYCQAVAIDEVAASGVEDAGDLDMGCLGIHFNQYLGGGLMLYTEREFNRALQGALDKAGDMGVPLLGINQIITDFCAQRDGRCG